MSQRYQYRLTQRLRQQAGSHNLICGMCPILTARRTQALPAEAGSDPADESCFHRFDIGKVSGVRIRSAFSDSL
jgi:hypothetical protein